MACLIKFVRLIDFAADIDELDLTANGYGLAQDGYFPTAAPDDVQSVREVITLKLQGTSKDDLAAMTQDIDEKIKQVGWWLREPGVERYQVWLRVQLENESLPRQAQIISVMPPDKVRVFTPEERLDNYIGEYQIGIERTPFWEDPYPYPTTTTKSGINCISGNVALSETINGDVPARLARFDLITDDGAYSKFWLGWRTSRFGVPANFVPVWSLKNGTGGIDTNTAADGSAFSGTKLRCTFGSDATLIQRCYMSVYNASASNPSDQRGIFTVLLRAKMSDASIARVRLAAGWMNLTGGTLANPLYRSRQVVSGTDWFLYEMGTVSIPSLKYSNQIVVLDNFAMSLQAERISGAGSLDLDCLILIPSAEGMIRATTSSDNTSVTDSLTLISPPNMQHYGFKTTSGYGLAVSHDTVIVSPIDWALPANNEAPRLIAAAQSLTVSVKGSTFSMSYTYIPRWRTLRGNVT